MNQENKLHGITRSQFFRDVLRETMGKGLSVGHARDWMKYFDAEMSDALDQKAKESAPQIEAAHAPLTYQQLAHTSGPVGGGAGEPDLASLLSVKSDGSITKKVSNALGINRQALFNRLSAVWFQGNANLTQEDAIKHFIEAALLIAGRHGNYHMLIPQLSYVLATVYHETAATMEPIEEYGKGKGRSYGEPDPQTGKTYYGRGYVQLTWKANYEKMQPCLYLASGHPAPLSLVINPDMALEPLYAMQIAAYGMLEGVFTGKKLADYINDKGINFFDARRIINGTDRAELVAGYANEALCAFKLARGVEIVRDIVSTDTRGADVRELQLMLGLTPDGIAGAKTVSAIRHLQEASGLVVDGVCGRNTWAALDSSCYPDVFGEKGEGSKPLKANAACDQA